MQSVTAVCPAANDSTKDLLEIRDKRANQLALTSKEISSNKCGGMAQKRSSVFTGSAVIAAVGEQRGATQRALWPCDVWPGLSQPWLWPVLIY